MKIILGRFIKETFLSKNPHFSEAGLIERVRDAWYDTQDPRTFCNYIKKGYREGVYLVSIDPTGFKRRFRTLKDGDYMFGQFKSRVTGEEPRKKIGVLNTEELPNAEYVDAVLYHKEVIREGLKQGEFLDSEDFDYEVVAFITKDAPEPQPMETEVLLHNKYGSDGGTDVKMTDEEFVKELGKSFKYWRNRSMIH